MAKSEDVTATKRGPSSTTVKNYINPGYPLVLPGTGSPFYRSVRNVPNKDMQRALNLLTEEEKREHGESKIPGLRCLFKLGEPAVPVKIINY